MDIDTTRINKSSIKKMSNTSRPEYIGEGSYGCVFKQSNHPKYDKCITFKINKKISSYVRKILYNEHDANVEINNHRKVMKIDPEGLFTVSVTRMCKNIDQKDLEIPLSESRKCTYIGEENHQSYFEIIYEDGGISIDDLMSTSYKSQRLLQKNNLPLILRSFETFLYGICRLDMSKIAHCDISLGNVVYNNGKMKIIDFGMCEELGKNLYSFERFKENKARFAHSSLFYVPEYKLIYMLHKYNKEFSYNDFIEFLVSIQIQPAMDILQIYGVDKIQTLYEDAETFYKDIMKEKDYVKLFSEQEHKIDVFATGMFLATLLAYSGTQYGKDKDLFKDLLNLSYEMIRYDPRKRLRSYSAYMQFCGIMTKYGYKSKCLGVFTRYAIKLGIALPYDELDCVTIKNIARIIDVKRSQRPKNKLLNDINICMKKRQC
jgi:serine/threonine protein kinase